MLNKIINQIGFFKSFCRIYKIINSSDAVANKDYLPDDAKEEIKQIYKDVEPLGDLIDEYLTIEEQNRELQIAFDEQREIDQAAEIVEPEGEDRAAKPSKGQEREPLELTAPTEDELTAKQDEIDRLTKENERLAKEAERRLSERFRFIVALSIFNSNASIFTPCFSIWLV